MVKIPTFTTEARPTAATPSVKADVSIPLTSTISNALKSATQAIVKHRVTEKNLENKTEALKLENESLLELTEVFEKAGRLDNKDQAFQIIQTESDKIRNIYANKASNKFVRDTFNNNFYSEVQKGIFKTNTRVSTNIIQSLDNQVSIKKNRLLTEAYLSNNKLAFKTIGTELEKLYEESYKGKIDDDDYDRIILGIPAELEVFEVNQMITNNPTQALQDLRNKDKFTNISLDTRMDLEKDALNALKPQIKENMVNYLAALEDGKKIDINEQSIIEAFGNDAYKNFKETEKNVINFSSYKSQLFNSKIGEERKIIDSYPVRTENYAQDLQYKQKLNNFLSKKDELIKEDAANLVLTFNNDVKNKYEEFRSATEPEVKNKLFKEYLTMTVEAQTNIGVDSDLIKVIPKAQAISIVDDYNGRTAQEKIGYLRSLEEQYGEYYGVVLSQLSANGLPVTAKLVSYLGDEKFALSSLSIDTKEEKDRLKNFLKGTDITFSEVQKSVADEIEEFRQVVLYSNPYNTQKANKELDEITEILTYMTINELSRGADEKDAVNFATGFITNNFDLSEETYFIPRIYNNDRLSSGQIEFIKKKANVIKERYLNEFNIESFKSENEEVTVDELNESVIDQAKRNGVWLNTADGSGIVFAIKFYDGTFGIVTNKEGKQLKLNFDDDSFLLPHTDVIMTMEKEKTIEEEAGGA